MNSFPTKAERWNTRLLIEVFLFVTDKKLIVDKIDKR